MVDARLTHPTRPTLPLIQRQRDTAERTAETSITAELGTDRPPLVHTETRTNQRQIRGLVSGNARAQADPNTSDPIQALANYLDRLESHVDEFQGFEGYTFEDDILNEQKRCAIESVEWTRQTGQPYDIEYQVTVRVGRPTMQSEALDRRNPTVDSSMSTMLVLDGEPLPGLREYGMARSVGLDVNAVFNRSTAENNDIVMNEGVQQQVSYEGVITGSASARASKDQALRDKLATRDPITLETKFPGYDLNGYLVGYNSEQRTDHGREVHHYSLDFIEGIRA